MKKKEMAEKEESLPLTLSFSFPFPSWPTVGLFFPFFLPFGQLAKEREERKDKGERDHCSCGLRLSFFFFLSLPLAEGKGRDKGEESLGHEDDYETVSSFPFSRPPKETDRGRG